MDETVFILFTQGKIEGMRKNPPTLKRGEHAFRLRVQVPDAYFEDRDHPTVEVELEPEEIAAPDVTATVEYPGLCMVTPALVENGDRRWDDLYRCPECGFEKKASEPFGPHYEPDEDEEDE